MTDNEKDYAIKSLKSEAYDIIVRKDQANNAWNARLIEIGREIDRVSQIQTKEAKKDKAVIDD